MMFQMPDLEVSGSENRDLLNLEQLHHGDEGGGEQVPILA